MLFIEAQTEGDTGYDYGDLDDNDYYDESGIVPLLITMPLGNRSDQFD